MLKFLLILVFCAVTYRAGVMTDGVFATQKGFRPKEQTDDDQYILVVPSPDEILIVKDYEVFSEENVLPTNFVSSPWTLDVVNRGTVPSPQYAVVLTIDNAALLQNQYIDIDVYLTGYRRQGTVGENVVGMRLEAPGSVTSSRSAGHKDWTLNTNSQIKATMRINANTVSDGDEILLIGSAENSIQSRFKGFYVAEYAAIDYTVRSSYLKVPILSPPGHQTCTIVVTNEFAVPEYSGSLIGIDSNSLQMSSKGTILANVCNCLPDFDDCVIDISYEDMEETNSNGDTFFVPSVRVAFDGAGKYGFEAVFTFSGPTTDASKVIKQRIVAVDPFGNTLGSGGVVNSNQFVEGDYLYVESRYLVEKPSTQGIYNFYPASYTTAREFASFPEATGNFIGSKLTMYFNAFPVDYS